MEFEISLQCSEEPSLDPTNLSRPTPESLCNFWKHDRMLRLGDVSFRSMPKLGTCLLSIVRDWLCNIFAAFISRGHSSTINVII
jgi:hypothetical protein